MAQVRFTRRAEADLLAIGEYTQRTWGSEQASRYLFGLEECCHRLLENPSLGRACEEIRPGLRRMEQARHVIFYRTDPEGIVVSRILHASMVPERHLPGEDPEQPR